MAQYNFKSITVVPTASELQDIVLSNTQRKTPTVIHKNYKISRIRSFYMRKVKHTQVTFFTKLEKILTDFPKIEDVHPFYADLMNVLYDKDHYKIALGQINVAKNLIGSVAKEFCRLLKYGESLYRCKQLKRAALGRMCTIIRRQKSNLAYLEEVRQHLSRLPSINPTERTLLICGFPNVGKSSFMNMVTRADVDVQPYAFTTKSLYVGHLDYKYVRFQVIDTPGILDHPLEERNTIEMQSITALAHLKAAVLFFMDISEQCGYSLEAQASLFHSIKPLFTNKPIMLVVNKTDILTVDELPEEKQRVIEEFKAEDTTIVSMSTLKGDGVHEAKSQACDMLLAYRLATKQHTEKVRNIAETRLQLHVPAPRDSKSRPPCIPEAVLKKRAMVEASSKKKLERDLADELEDDYITDLRKMWILQKKDEAYDVIPEILNGKNIADYIDPDIEERLRKLELEEDEREAAGLYDDSDSDDDEKMALRQKAAVLREKRKIKMMESREKRRIQKARLPRAAKRKDRSSMEAALGEVGVEIDSGDETHLSRMKSRSASRKPLKRKREESVMGRSRSASRPPRDRSGLRDETMVQKARKIANKAQKPRAHQARKGEGDRVILNMKPKHLFSGKRKMGKTQRR